MSSQAALRQRALKPTLQPPPSQASTIDPRDDPRDDLFASFTTTTTTTSSSLSLSRLIPFLLLFRLLNALLTQTYFQPDEHWQSQEMAHRLVFGYGYTTWEWRPFEHPAADGYLAATWSNLFNGPIRSVLHPLVFVPVYWALKVCRLDGTRLLVLAPRLYQALFAALGDAYTFKLAHKVGGGRRMANCSLFVALTNIYSFFTATRTFSNTLEATVTVIALSYWPFEPQSSWQAPAMYPALEKAQLPEGRQRLYRRTLSRSLWLAALACLLRPTNGIIWIFLFGQLLWRTAAQLSGAAREGRRGKGEEASTANGVDVKAEVGALMASVIRVALSALLFTLMLDTLYYASSASSLTAVHRSPSWPQLFGLPLPLATLTPLSFFHRNVIASLSLFYGANSWHFYLMQGVPVLCLTWLPYAAIGWARAAFRTGRGPMADLAKVTIWTIGVFSLLGHKEFRFLQPLLPLLCIFAGSTLERSLPSSVRLGGGSSKDGATRAMLDVFRHVPMWQRTLLVTVQVPVAIFLTTFHCRGQEAVTYHLGKAVQRQMGRGGGDEVYGRIESIGFLMPCHSTPWQSSLHWSPAATKDGEDGVGGKRVWFIECPPPGPGQPVSTYKDQSDYFYADPYLYLVERFPSRVDETFPLSPASAGTTSRREGYDLGWTHTWPSHVVLFDALLDGAEGQESVATLLKDKGYRRVKRFWNSFKHEDARREGDVVVLAHRSVLAGR